MKYTRPDIKAERFTVSDSLLGPELSSNDFFIPADDSNAPGGSGSFGYEVWQDAIGMITNE